MGHGFNFSREGITDTWQTGIDSDSSYVIRASDATNVVTANQQSNVALTGNLVVGKILTSKRVPGVSDTTPLTIINESPGGGTGVVYQSTASDQGFLIAYTTAQSSVAWVEGVNWGWFKRVYHKVWKQWSDT